MNATEQRVVNRYQMQTLGGYRTEESRELLLLLAKNEEHYHEVERHIVRDLKGDWKHGWAELPPATRIEVDSLMDMAAWQLAMYVKEGTLQSEESIFPEMIMAIDAIVAMKSKREGGHHGL